MVVFVATRKEKPMKIMIDTDWFAAMKDLPTNKQKEIMTAIMDYPNKESDTYLWKNVIKPSLERGKISYYNKINSLKQYNPQKTNKKISDTVSVTDTDTGIRTESNIIKSNIIENKGGVGGKETIDPEKKKRNVEQFEAMIQQLGQITKRQPNETIITYNEVRMPETLKQFIQQKFRPDTRKRAYDWMIDHVAGQQWNEDRIIKLLCKFESANVPETRAEYIQLVSKTNRPIGCMAQKTA